MDPLDFYTVESKEKNAFTPYVKTVRLFGGTRKNPKWLPTRRYVFPEGGKRILPFIEHERLLWCSSTPTLEQDHVITTVLKRKHEHAYGC